MNTDSQSRVESNAEPLTVPVDADYEQRVLDALVERVRQKFSDGLIAIVLYGSCRRSGCYSEGVVDFYVIVERRVGLESAIGAFLGGFLPPNVYYLEAPVTPEASQSVTARCKVGVYTLGEMQRAVSADFHSYTYARWLQPIRTVYVADHRAQRTIATLQRMAAQRFLCRAVPIFQADALERAGTEAGLEPFIAGFQTTYAAELRVESGGRAAEVVANDQAYYQDLLAQLSSWHLDYHSVIGNAVGEQAAGGPWLARRWIGKLLSVLRLLKGLLTFTGGVDYIVWKLERHSGRRIELPERARRWPLLFIWGPFWRLYREGVFR